MSNNNEQQQQQPPPAQNVYALQTETQRKILLRKYKPDNLYVVTKKYIANKKLCQINQNINDLVGLIKPYDPANQHHIWFVDNGKSEGFIPREALTPYNELFQDLIDLGNDSEEQHKSGSSTSSSTHLDEFSSLIGPNFSFQSNKDVVLICSYKVLRKYFLMILIFKKLF